MPDYQERQRWRRERYSIHGPGGYSTEERENLPPVGQSNLATMGLAIGLLLMVIQLWLLTIAFDAYLAGNRGQTLGVAICSGLVFLGGLLMLRFLNRRPARWR
ncbi:MAG TPA: DUF6755 family protein [Thermomicrobiales bacterium]|nr:DUF6755 family protein [Thermomicrobiales bacterium]